MGRLFGTLAGSCALLAWLAGAACSQDKVLVVNAGSPNMVSCSRLGCERIDFTNPATFDEQSGKDNAERIQEWAESLDSSPSRFLVVDGKYAIADHDDDGIDVLWPEIVGGGIHTIGRSARAAYFPNGLAEGNFIDNSSGFFHVGDNDDTMICYPGSHGDFDLRLVGRICQTQAQLYAAVGDDVSAALSGATFDYSGNADGERCLTSTGAFASYTWAQGDYIRILAATGGVAPGGYYVASKVDSDAILLLEASGLTDDATGISSVGPPNRARTGLLIRNTDTGPPGAKMRLSITGQVLESVVRTDWVGEHNHGDNLSIDLIEHRWCDYQIWCDTNDQSVGWTVFNSNNDGSPCKALFRFDHGGDLTCMRAFHPLGTLLQVGPNISHGGSMFNVMSVKLDNVVSTSPRTLILDCQDADAYTQVRVGGIFGGVPVQQMVRTSTLR